MICVDPMHTTDLSTSCSNGILNFYRSFSTIQQRHSESGYTSWSDENGKPNRIPAMLFMVCEQTSRLGGNAALAAELFLAY